MHIVEFNEWQTAPTLIIKETAIMILIPDPFNSHDMLQIIVCEDYTELGKC